jgi:hypothetical protein
MSRIAWRPFLTLSAATCLGLWLTAFGAVSSWRPLGLAGAVLAGLATGFVERRHDKASPVLWRHVLAWSLWALGAWSCAYVLQPTWPRLEAAWSLPVYAVVSSLAGALLAMAVDARRSHLAARVVAAALAAAMFRAELLTGAFMLAGLGYAAAARRGR